MDRFLLALALIICTTAVQAGRSITVSPGFAYYQARSCESIAEEISVNGFSDVRLISINKIGFTDELLGEFNKRGIKVWYACFCNGVYPPAELPRGWEAWQMKMRRPARPDGFISFCPNHPQYRAWKKANIVDALKRRDFHGIDLMEPFLPAYRGPVGEHYGCLCDHCSGAFKRMYPEVSGIPDFEDDKSPRYWKNDTSLYAKWVEFRVATVIGFLDELVNGRGGVRERCPKVKVATWSLGCAIPDQLKNLREWEAVDGSAIVRRVRPDLHVIQTDWPDWMKPDLPPGYPSSYKPVLDSIRAVAPSLPIVLQADIGSKMKNRRGLKWLAGVEQSARETGFTYTTSYEYFIGGYMYTEPPAVVKAKRAPGGVRLVWNKRVDPVSGGNVENYSLNSGRVTAATVDGNIVHLAVPGAESGLILSVSGVRDDAARRLFKDHPPCEMRGIARIQVR